MAIELSSVISPAEVALIVESVYQTMLGLDITPSSEPWVPTMDRLSASVQFSGEWNGAVLIQCSHQMACQLAGRYLSMEPAAQLDDLVGS